jgi:endoglucanase
VVDASNQCRIRLEGVNWYGMQTQYYVPAGLDFASYSTVLALIKSLGFNSVRIPLSDQLVRNNATITIGSKYIKKSPELKGLHPLEVLDLIVAQAQADGLWVILDNHDAAAVTKAQIQSEQKGASPVWTAPGYTQRQWINDWLTLANRYSDSHPCGIYGPAQSNCTDVPTVVGFDLHNEPHTSQGAPVWNMKAYLKYGSVWGGCSVRVCGTTYATAWTKESPSKQAASNWPDAATMAANAILTVNPHLLMIVEGTQLYPDVSAKHPTAVDSYWWGSVLKGILVDPINLATPAFEQQLVYSPHEWGPWKFDSPQFYEGKAGYSQLAKLFNSQWGFILHMKNPHPIWMGEFNTCNRTPTKKFAHVHSTLPRIRNVAQCTADTRKNSEGLWWTILIKFLQQNPEIGWSYYPFNPVNSVDGASNNSIQYKSGRLDNAIMNALRKIEGPPQQ